MAKKDLIKIRSNQENLFLRVVKGHFATGHSHTNYYIDVTLQKMRLSEAKAVAEELLRHYKSSTIIDTILCLDGMEVVGACLAEGLTRSDFASMNAHNTIYVVTPEHTSGSQLIFRDNISPMIIGKHVLVLAASVSTGFTIKSAMEAIRYYNGNVAGISAIFSTLSEFDGIPVVSTFDPNALGDYGSYSAPDCPLCKQGARLDALINGYGCSML